MEIFLINEHILIEGVSDKVGGTYDIDNESNEVYTVGKLSGCGMEWQE